MPAAILAFDIETIPDVAALRRLHHLPDALADGEVVDMCQRLLRQKRSSDFFPLHLHRVAAISCVLRRLDSSGGEDALKIFSLPHEAHTDEAEAVDLFYRLMEKYQPLLVSWNGGGFDLPVLHYRGLAHRKRAPLYWKTDGDFKWNSYTSRFHERHTDLMDVLSGYQVRAAAPLSEVAQLCGLPGKIGIGGGGVWEAWQAGDIAAIRRYCENDALLTYLLYVRYQHLRGRMDSAEEDAFIRRQLQADEPRWREFLAGWREESAPPAGADALSNTLF